MFPDMTKELAERRKAFTSLKHKLQELSMKYTLAYPATGEKRSFATATAADKFISDNDHEEGAG